VCVAQICAAEVCTTQVYAVAYVDAAQVYAAVEVEIKIFLRAPRVPLSAPLLQSFDVIFVCHGCRHSARTVLSGAVPFSSCVCKGHWICGHSADTGPLGTPSIFD